MAGECPHIKHSISYTNEFDMGDDNLRNDAGFRVPCDLASSLVRSTTRDTKRCSEGYAEKRNEMKGGARTPCKVFVRMFVRSCDQRKGRNIAYNMIERNTLVAKGVLSVDHASDNISKAPQNATRRKARRNERREGGILNCLTINGGLPKCGNHVEIENVWGFATKCKLLTGDTNEGRGPEWLSG
jgi:hypothetical protein